MTRLAILVVLGSAACAPSPAPSSVLLITIDTLRADAVGSYGGATARTPTLDQLARNGVRVDRAWATAPITLPSHASILSGRYPPSHGSRHNGLAMDGTVPTLATALKARGFATAAFVSAFPLDRRFGLARGFDVYDDEMPRPAGEVTRNERPGGETVDRASAWLDTHRAAPFFLWVHLFDPHAPYGRPDDGRSAHERYAEEVATTDQQVNRLLQGLGREAINTLVIVTADHGEAFGEHGEIGHSVFVYDTTLRVPLVLSGPGVPPATVVTEGVSLVDIAPTIMALTGGAFEADGRSLVPAFSPGTHSPRAIYAESFAPQLDFGWAGLRSVRDGRWKYIAAPRPELFDLSLDPGERTDVAAADVATVARLDAVVGTWSGAELDAAAAPSGEAAARLRALGYLQGASNQRRNGRRVDPKDRIEIAARLAEVTSGELQGAERIRALTIIVRDDPGNPYAHLRLGYAHLEQGRCTDAEPHFRAALQSGIPSADAGLGLADCRGRAGDLAAARQALLAARRAEPGNPVVAANLGLLALEENRVADAITELHEALGRDPLLFQARFALARALARSGDRAGAVRQAELLLQQLPTSASQRSEIGRFLQAVR